MESRPRTQKKKKNPRPRPMTDFSRSDPVEAKGRNALGQGWKYRLVIDITFFAFLLSIIANAFCFQFFVLSPLLCFLLTCYRLVESLYFTFVLVESALVYIVLFLLCYIALNNYSTSVFFISFSSAAY